MTGFSRSVSFREYDEEYESVDQEDLVKWLRGETKAMLTCAGHDQVKWTFEKRSEEGLAETEWSTKVYEPPTEEWTENLVEDRVSVSQVMEHSRLANVTIVGTDDAQ